MLSRGTHAKNTPTVLLKMAQKKEVVAVGAEMYIARRISTATMAKEPGCTATRGMVCTVAKKLQHVSIRMGLKETIKHVSVEINSAVMYQVHTVQHVIILTRGAKMSQRGTHPECMSQATVS